MKKWAFIIHPRDMVDMGKLNGHIPKFINHWIVKRMGPHVISHVISEESEGWLIGCFLFPDQFYSLPLSFVQNKILKSVLFAKQLGAKVIGLGELTSPFTFGGRWLTRKVPALLITNGNSLTAAVVAKETERIFQSMNSKSKEIWIAIVGATGSVGNAVSQMLKEKNLILVARNTQKLEKLRSFVLLNDNRVIVSTRLKDIEIADLVIVLTSAAEAIIRPEYLKPASVVYDITQPSNVTPQIAKKRPDIIVVKGGLMRKTGLELNFDMRIPEETVFACLAETIVLSEISSTELFSQPDLVRQAAKVNVAEKIFALAKEYGFKPNLNSVEKPFEPSLKK